MLAIAGLALGGCPKPEQRAAGGDTVPDPHPPEYAPGPPLEVPRPADPDAFGYDYLMSVEPLLQGRWQGFVENCRARLSADHAFNDESLAVTVELTISEQGWLDDIHVAETSGSRDFDQVALEIVLDAARFSPPPIELRSDDGRVHMSWRFARDRRQAGAAGASIALVEWPLDRAVPMLLERGGLVEAARRIGRGIAAGEVGEGTVVLLDGVAEAVIAKALAADDVALQRAALNAVARARFASVAPRVRELATGAVELELRTLAIEALGAVGDAASIDLLAEIVAGPGDEQQRAAAARALHVLGQDDRAWRAVRGALSSGDESTRAAALFVLAHFPAQEAVPDLGRELAGAGKRDLRLAAAAALGAAVETAGHKAGKPLVRCLEEGDAALRAACAQALADAGRNGYTSRVAFWATAKLLTDADERVRAAAAVASAVLGKESFANELYRLRKESKAGVLAALAEGLGYVPGEVALSRLLGLAGDEDVTIRRAVARALARREEAAARTLLTSWDGDSDLEIRMTAIRAVDDAARLATLAADERPEVASLAVARWQATAGRGAVLAEATRLLAEAPSLAQRAMVAGGWLAGR